MNNWICCLFVVKLSQIIVKIWGSVFRFKGFCCLLIWLEFFDGSKKWKKNQSWVFYKMSCTIQGFSKNNSIQFDLVRDSRLNNNLNELEIPDILFF